MNEQASKPIEYVCEETGEIYSAELAFEIASRRLFPEWVTDVFVDADGNLHVFELGAWLKFTRTVIA